MVASNRKLTPSIGWDLKLIDEHKRIIKQDLDAHSDPMQDHSRLELIFQRLGNLADDDSDVGRLCRYIYAMSALVHHERIGGLSDRDVTRLVELAYAILQAQGVRPRASRLAALYGDIHLIKSQIDRKAGYPWRAAWEQQMALQLAGDLPSGGLGFQRLGMGNRALRLGHAQLALRRFMEAESAGLDDGPRARCWLGRMHALWLGGHEEEASAIAERIVAEASVQDDIRREVVWFQLLRQFQRTGDLSPLLKTIRHDGTYYEGTYIIETCLWGYTIESRGFINRLPRLASIRRNKKLLPQRLGAWYDAGLRLQECYDHNLPLPIRLRGLSQILEERDRLLTVDKELLILAAATRWLARSKSQDLALLVFSEYQSLCRRLSDGRTSDCLHVLRDIAERDWLAAESTES